jgi:hypothetical protein
VTARGPPRPGDSPVPHRARRRRAPVDGTSRPTHCGSATTRWSSVSGCPSGRRARRSSRRTSRCSTSPSTCSARPGRC